MTNRVSVLRQCVPSVVGETDQAAKVVSKFGVSDTKNEPTRSSSRLLQKHLQKGSGGRART